LDLLAILGSGTYDQGNYFPAGPTALGGVGSVAVVPEPGISLAGAIAAATFAFLAHRRSSGAQNRLGSNRIAHRD
jgi:hypothetical protein